MMDKLSPILLCNTLAIQSDKHYLFASRMNNLTQSTLASQPSLPDRKPVPPPPNGAPLNTDKNRRRPPGRLQSFQIWGDTPESDLFVTLLKILKDEPEGIKLQNLIMSHRDTTKDLLRTSLRSFSGSKQLSTLYQNEYSKKPHLGMGVEQLGFKKGAIINQSAELTAFWRRLIEITATELHTNLTAAFKIVRKYVRQSGIFKRLYEQQGGGLTIRPKADQIGALFKVGGREIDEDSVEFKVLFTQIVAVYFQEINSCIYCLNIFFDPNNVQYQGFRSLFAPGNNFSMLEIMWNAYEEISTDVLATKPKDSGGSVINESLRGEIFTRKIKLLLNLIKLFYSFLTSFEDNPQASQVRNIKQFHVKVIKQLDKDIIEYEKTSNICGVNIFNFSKFIVELFLLLFPYETFTKADKTRKDVNNAGLYEAIKQIQSEPLKLIKVLLANGIQTQTNRAELAKKIKEFDEIAKSGEWSAYTIFWKNWLGIFLKKYRQHFKMFEPQLARRIIKLCKTVAAEEYHEFWDEDEAKKPLYLAQIKKLLQEAMAVDFQDSTNYALVLPICTKLMGNITKGSSYAEKVIGLLSQGGVQSVFNSITFSLKIDQHRNQNPQDRIVYRSREYNNNLEHEIKFVCKLVELYLGRDLAFLEGIFLRIQSEPSMKEAGTMLIIKLLQIFYSISPEAQSDLKCLRYLIKTINALFVCAKTRDLLCVALAAVESGKASYPKALRTITSRCYDYDLTTQLGRQAEKLRNAISYHLNCILRISDTLQQYFPTTTQRQVVHKYRTLQEYLQQENVDHSYHQMSKIIKTGQSEFKSVSWFYEFAKLFQSSRLTSVDLNSISLLLQKMRIKNKEAREYANLSMIVDILNNGRLQDTIIGALTPLAKRELNKKQQEKHFLGLANKEIQGFMTRPMGEYLSGEKYSSHVHKLEKQKNQADKEKIELYCKLSGCLTIIETVLKLRLEGDFPLLKKIDFVNSLLESLYGEHPHIYKVKFITKVEKIAEKRDFMNLLNKREVEQEMESSVNLLHCVASLWNMEGRLDIDETHHPSYSLNIKGTLFSDFTNFISKVRHDIFMYSQESVLTNFTRTTHSLGIGTVGKILEYTVLLGFGKKLYYSILSRSYPLTKGLINANDRSVVMDEFMGGVLKAASHQAATINEKRQVIELLSVLIQQSAFGEYIRSNIFRFKEAISQGKEFAIRSTSIHLITQFLLFLNLLLSIDSSELNIRFAKSCLTDPIEFGKKLLDHCMNRLKDPNAPTDKNSKYVTFEWCLTLREGAVCKLALFLYLGVVSYLISNEHSSLAIGLCSLIISKSDIFINNSTFECSEQLDMLLPLDLKERQQAPELIKGNTYSSLIIDQYFLNAIFLNNPFSFAENYIEQPWEVMQNSTPKQAKRLVLAAHRVNSANASHYAGEAMAQFYFLLLNSIFQRGHNGLFFLTTQGDKFRPPQVMLFKKEKAKNDLSLKQLFGEDEGFLNCCFRLCKNLQRQIWQNPHNKAPRDISLTIIRQILRSVERNIADQPHHLPETQRLTDKIATYLRSASSSFNFIILASTLQSLLQLANKLLGITTVGKKYNIFPSFEAYFQRIEEILDTLFSNIQLDSLAKLSQEHLYTFLLFSLYLFDMEIENIQQFQNKHRMHYLENDSRCSMLEKFQKIFKSALSLLNNPKATPHTTSLVLQMCNKSLYIDFQSKKSAVVRIVRPQSQLFIVKLQKIGEKLSYEDVLVGTYLGKFIMQVSVFAQPEQNRQIMRIVKAGFTGMEHRLKKITEVKSLTEIQQCSNLVGAFASLAMEEQHWRNEQFSGILDKIFLILQDKPLKFDYQRIVPEEKLQVELNNKHFGSSTRGRSYSIFSFYSSLCMYELARNFLFFLSFSLTSSPTLHQFCNNTFNNGLLEDLSLDRLRESLNNMISFLTRFVSQLFNNDIEQVLNISNFACYDYEFIREMNLAPLCFERYPNKEDFHSSLAQTITLTNQSIQLLCQTWQRYDWKATCDWRPSKNDLLKQFQKLLQVYRSYFKDYKEQSCERSMRSLEERIKQDLDGFTF